MRLEQLEYLCEIAKRKSMNLASTKLFVSQQTLSTAMKNLEKELDCKLLERTYHGVFPTEIGQELIDISQDMLIRLDQLKLKIAAQNNTQLSGDLSIAVEPGINMLIMPKVVSYFYKYYPRINTRIIVLSRVEIIEALQNQEYDIGIITVHDNMITPGDEQINSDLLTKDIIDFQWLARVNRLSPLASEESISLRTLLNYPLALNNDSSGMDLMSELRKYGDPYIMTTYNYGVSQQLVYDNLAVSLAVKANNYLPYYFNNFNGEIINIPIKESLPFNASYVLHKDHPESDIINCFIDTLIKIT